MSAADRPPRSPLSRGILYMVASTVVFAGVNAIVKWEVALYPVGEIAFFRALFALIAVAAMILPRHGFGVFRTRRYLAHIQRGLSQFGSMTCMFLAFRLMPLGAAVAVSFAAPLFTTLLAIVVLKEKVGIHRWSALIVGFLGVVLIAGPDTGAIQPGAVFALGNAILISSVAVAIRKMSVTESTETLTLYQMSVITLCTLFILPFGFIVPTWYDALALAIAGIGNGIAQFWWTRSLSLAPPSAVAPFNYMSLVWANLLGFAIWGDVPTTELLIGSGIIVGSGLYIVWRETLRRAARGAAPPAAATVTPAGTAPPMPPSPR